ncbi:hypothetical protein DFP91_3636 [Pseudorhodoplanes sinuspersici]|uniref:Uncharacterized protein n=1 Tax=Pseudorhodoplanes sinuspersici TaxID=1235591 RepID=A0A1W6ZP41_9HYPH|nr:hypothetical protein CAK95_08605 [Pseudorhodoplanes sinuspersici]RKE69208.1 hypothetical protein DFP91_3636 [Pseudorhodoplanes sinuspersici]
MKKIIVHAGFHKTGTTSIQSFLNRNRHVLRAADIDFYSGRYISNNHVELHAASMRDERMSSWKKASGFRSSAMFPVIAAQIKEAIDASPCKTILFSAEGISYLRFEDEIRRLHDLLGRRQTSIIIYQRERSAWLESFKAQLSTHIPFSTDKDAFNYVEPDTWLLDFETRIGAFQKAFGAENVTVVDYDGEVTLQGSVIPSFLSAIGARKVFHAADWEGVWENKRQQSRISIATAVSPRLDHAVDNSRRRWQENP